MVKFMELSTFLILTAKSSFCFFHFLLNLFNLMILNCQINIENVLISIKNILLLHFSTQRTVFKIFLKHVYDQQQFHNTIIKNIKYA